MSFFGDGKGEKVRAITTTLETPSFHADESRLLPSPEMPNPPWPRKKLRGGPGSTLARRLSANHERAATRQKASHPLLDFGGSKAGDLRFLRAATLGLGAAGDDLTNELDSTNHLRSLSRLSIAWSFLHPQTTLTELGLAASPRWHTTSMVRLRTAHLPAMEAILEAMVLRRGWQLLQE